MRRDRKNQDHLKKKEKREKRNLNPFSKYLSRGKGLSLRGKEAVTAYVFLIPFLIGLLGLFLPTIVQSVQFSFSDMSVGSNGYELTPADNHGFEHYIYSLSIEPYFTRELLSAIRDMVIQVPLVLIFSFFVAILLNQDFHGRTIARSIFFFPVILTSGIILAIERQDLLLNQINGEDMSQMEGQISAMLNVGRLLKYTDLPHNVVAYLTKAITGIYDIAIASGVQILIFLAGLQTIPPSLFEASMIEGATGWENFWKITFPMISPLIIVNGLYSIIDSFTRSSNPMMTDIQQTIFGNVQYGYGSAKAWIYFIAIIIVIALVGAFVKNKVVYTD